jgi:hypothetical protein
MVCILVILESTLVAARLTQRRSWTKRFDTTMPAPTFMTLPMEVRQQIFGLIYDDFIIHLQRPGVSPESLTLGAHKPLHVPPLLVSKQFRQMFIVEYLRSSTIYIDNILDLTWARHELEALFHPRIELADHVRRIKLLLTLRVHTVGLLEFVGRCRSLQEVWLHVRITHTQMTIEELKSLMTCHLVGKGIKEFYLTGMHSNLVPVSMRQVRDELRAKIVASSNCTLV